MPGLRAFLGMPRGVGGEVLTSFVCLYSSFNSRFFSSKERDVGPLFLPYGESSKELLTGNLCSSCTGSHS